jgi:two-component system, chemotaxis family, CheB/CheR fusion protein
MRPDSYPPRKHDDVTPAGAVPFFVVGVGASAGGLEALQEFFANIEENPGIAFIVIQHLSPDFKSMMSELIARHTQITVSDAEDGMELMPDRVYVLPNRKDIRIAEGRLVLTEREAVRGLHLPIDILFESLAQAQGELSAAVVLSGTGSDGTRGMRAVKEVGGMAFAQDPASSRFDGMPRSAIATGLVDCVLPAGDLAKALVRAVLSPDAVRAELQDEERQAIDRLYDLIQTYAGVDFGLYKSATIERRIRRRLFIVGQTTIQGYVEYIERENSELDQLVRELLIGVTRFFRDTEAWTDLRTRDLPALIASVPAGGVLRGWVAGCSTGEEAYTLAMVLDDAIRESGRQISFRIFATDVNSGSVAFASAGAYAESAVLDVPEALRERYFERKDERYFVRRSLRDLITFAIHNLAADPPFTRLDLVTCRNLLIYLRPEVQLEALSRLTFGLRAGGLLFLGSSESLKESQLGLRTANNKWKVFVADTDRRDSREQKRGILPVSRTPSLSTRPLSSPPRGSDAVVQQVAERFAPPGVAVSEGFDVLHLFGDAGRFLSMAAGKVTLNLLRMVPQGLSVMLSSSARRVLETREPLRLPQVDFGTGERIDVRVEPLYGLPGVGRGMFICFELPVAPGGAAATVDIDHATSRRIAELEDELALTRDNLHSAVQDLETSNEELQATNEELVASNEELQSTNEELQSVNEELYTVNSEYQEKIDELERLNDDLENLLRFVSVGTLFLDRDLRIRRYNDRARSLFPLLAQDVGRPLDDIALKAHYPSLMTDVRSALEGNICEGQEVCSEDGAWWNVRVAPLVRSDASTGGVILTFHDISRLKSASRRAHCLLQAPEAFASVEGIVGYFAGDMRTREVDLSLGARRLLGLSPTSAVPSELFRPLFAAATEDVDEGLTELPVTLESARGESLRVFAVCTVRNTAETETMLMAALRTPSTA